ncbi:MAG: ankyrin repeat domain-containing protein [Bdellovibrionales bacterium]|nr:ankyrin repeat domain-containing protein [Bdellovibrionales bacterium]
MAMKFLLFLPVLLSMVISAQAQVDYQSESPEVHRIKRCLTAVGKLSEQDENFIEEGMEYLFCFRLVQKIQNRHTHVSQTPTLGRKEQLVSSLMDDYYKFLKSSRVGDLKTMKKLLRGGRAELELIDSEYRTALMLSAQYRWLKIVKYLLGMGASLEGRSKSERTVLIFGADSDNLEIVKILVEYGAELNLSDDIGWTPLIYAIKKQNTEMVEFLIAHGADVNARDHEGMSPYRWARRMDHEIIMQILLDHGSTGS